MRTSTFKIENIGTKTGSVESHHYGRRMKAWVAWLKVDTDWQVNRPMVPTPYDEKGEVKEYNGRKMIFNGIIEVKKENKELTYSYAGKIGGIEKESFVLDEIGPDIILKPGMHAKPRL